MEYPNVKNSHIVPRMYLAHFADPDGRIGVRQVDERKDLVRPIRDVGTRRRFYRRNRPTDGTPIDDVEWALGVGEAEAAPVLADLEARWPLALPDKQRLAEIFGLQLIRGTRYREEYGALTRVFIDRYQRENPSEVTDEGMDEFLASHSYRLIRMMAIAPALAGVVASMHWTLIEFASPLLATSDHPVVVWPIDVRSRRPEPTPIDGLLETLEYRLPLSSTKCLLMTWADKFDDAETRVRGTRDHAANINAFTVAQADRQWFYYPGTRPPIGAGRFIPLSPGLVAGYSFEAARVSDRRSKTSTVAHEMINREDGTREVAIVSMPTPT